MPRSGQHLGNDGRHLNLAGRSFLHDYAWRRDPGFKVLELIMTAPKVVTNWINLQYHASTVDNARYGSGDKVLHNVVGGNIIARQTTVRQLLDNEWFHLLRLGDDAGVRRYRSGGGWLAATP